VETPLLGNPPGSPFTPGLSAARSGPSLCSPPSPNGLEKDHSFGRCASPLTIPYWDVGESRARDVTCPCLDEKGVGAAAGFAFAALLTGTERPDLLTGTKTNDHIAGSANNDSINGRAGNDALFGDGGNDTLDGGPGRDNVQGGTGQDGASGGDGNGDFVSVVDHETDDRAVGGGGDDDICVGDFDMSTGTSDTLDGSTCEFTDTVRTP
jgi:hemolysin type calcium-binding protein